VTYSLEILTTDTQFMALAEEWPALLSASGHENIFLTWEWLCTWWRAFGPGNRLWLITARASDGQLVGAAPLAIGRRSRRGLVNYRELFFLGSGLMAADHLDFVVRDQDTAVYRALIAHLWRERRAWDVLHFDSLMADSPVIGLLQGQTAVAWQHISQTPCPYVLLPASWEAYEAGLGKNLRYNLRRYGRQLQAASAPEPIIYAESDTTTDLCPILQALGAFHQAIRHKKGQTSAFDDPRTLPMLQQLCDHLARQGWLRLTWLIRGQQPLAVLLGFRYGSRFFFYMTGYNADWSSLGPGRQTMAFSLRRAIEEGLGEYDFLRGDEDYKYTWQAQDRLTTTIQLGRGWLGRLVMGATRGKERFTGAGR
jgi:CelD/BcsL family acetyltransferase involved in cellulose biosynthesis